MGLDYDRPDAGSHLFLSARRLELSGPPPLCRRHRRGDCRYFSQNERTQAGTGGKIIKSTMHRAHRKETHPAAAQRPRGASSRQGFTFIELILVLVIVSIAFSIVAPAIGNRLSSGDPKRTALQLRSTMELLRIRALIEGKEQLLIVDPQGNQYWLESAGHTPAQDEGEQDEVHRVPSGGGELSARGIWVRDNGEVEFRFYPGGMNSGGDIFIEQRRGLHLITYTVHLNPLLGTATIQYGE